jgi:copper chaperone
MSQSTEHVYTVQGMTCEHCVAAVKGEVDAVAGAELVTVELDSGRLTVLATELDDEAIREAVEEAGYTLA